MSKGRSVTSVAFAVLGLLLLAGCGQDVQSVLAPQGSDARRIALLFWIMTVSGSVIFIGVLLLTAAAMFGGERIRNVLSREAVVIGGGIAFPIAALTLLLGYGLVVMSQEQSVPAEGEIVRASVIGEQWWWRVIYRGQDQRLIESANELRIPVNRPVELSLSTADVIHSFWVPKLAGKLDMIPGRVNTLRFVANEAGVSRGQCAEYCGGAHALMSLYVVALPEQEYVQWHAKEAADATLPASGPAQQGMMLFMASGCGSCHTIRGTEARGRIGPDLTHFGSRLSLGAAVMSNNIDTISAWIADNQHIKPDNRMPPFKIFDATELRAIAHYLEGLK